MITETNFCNKLYWPLIFVFSLYFLPFCFSLIFQKIVGCSLKSSHFNFPIFKNFKSQSLYSHHTHLISSKKNLSRLDKILQGCGDVCNHSIQGVPSLYFDYIEKVVNCQELWMNEAIDENMIEENPPAMIPDNMMDGFTYGGKVPIGSNVVILNQRYLGKTAEKNKWELDYVNSMIEQCQNGVLHGNYGVDETNFLKLGLERMSLQNANVLVIGSENPWVEACVLSAGAKNVYTLEYGTIESEHPNIFTMTPNDFRKQYNNYYEFFDAVVTFSSVEHSGLGRYGDAMNPWGDRQAVARAWCASKPGARLLMAVMTGDDKIEYNAHRVYGKIMYPHLVANWKQLWRSPGGSQIVYIFEK